MRVEEREEERKKKGKEKEKGKGITKLQANSSTRNERKMSEIDDEVEKFSQREATVAKSTLRLVCLQIPHSTHIARAVQAIQYEYSDFSLSPPLRIYSRLRNLLFRCDLTVFSLPKSLIGCENHQLSLRSSEMAFC